MSLLGNVADVLLTPVQVAIAIFFVYSLFEAGRLVVQWPLRRAGRAALDGAGTAGRVPPVYPLLLLHARNPALSTEQLDVAAIKQLETVRIATRITPMLGLMATLIPMGPALVALTKNDVAQMSELLRLAFSSVVLALASASLCFWIATVRRRWCAEEVVAIKGRIGGEA